MFVYMSLKIASNSLFQSPLLDPFQPFPSKKLSICSTGSCSLIKHAGVDGMNIYPLSLFSSSCYRSRKSSKLDEIVLRGSSIKRFCSENLGEVFGGESSEHNEIYGQTDGGENEQGYGITNATCITSNTNTGAGRAGNRKSLYIENSFWKSKSRLLEPTMLGIRADPPAWPEREAILRDSIERKANSADLPLSLRVIKKNQHRKMGSGNLGDPLYRSMHKAFSSTVSIILELQSHALQTTELVYNEDLEGIRTGVQSEIYTSFIWLFQQVLSRTPTLMIHVIMFFANFSLHSMDNNVVIAPPSPFRWLHGSTTELIIKTDEQADHPQLEIDSPGSRHTSFSINKDDGTEDTSIRSHLIQYPETVSETQVGGEELRSEMELNLWNSIVDEARRMQNAPNDMVFYHEEMRCVVSPVSAELEPENYAEYSKTDLLYQLSLLEEPTNPLLFSNYAKFLHLVKHDYDRAEDCFKRAIQIEPTDAESLCQYANFLWLVRNDLWGAEERYLQGLEAEPNNPFHASQYAHFLWHTGGEETCFPLEA